MVTELLSRLRKQKVSIRLVDGKLDVKAPKGVLTPELVGEIKEYREELIHSLNGGRATEKNYEEIPKAPEAESYPLSSAQERLWMVSQFSDASRAYNISGSREFEGGMNVEALEKAFHVLMERHETLRTVYHQNAEGAVRQFILPVAEAGFTLRVNDVRNRPGRDGWVTAAVIQDNETPFSLHTGPLFRASLYRLEDGWWLLTYVMHHIISDAITSALLMQELMILYSSYAQGHHLSPQPLRLQYRDYAVWQRQQLSNGAFDAHRNYWLSQFAGELPVLNLPGDYPRPAIKTYSGSTLAGMAGRAGVAAAKEICQQQGATLFMYLLTVTHVLLYRLTQQKDIILGSPVAGRYHEDLYSLIGFFVNTLAFRCQLQGGEDFLTLLQTCKKQTLAAFEYQAYPFDSLLQDLELQRDLSRSPLVDVMVVLQNAGIGLSPEEVEDIVNNGKAAPGDGRKQAGISKYDLTFTYCESGDDILVEIEYNTSIWSRNSIERILRHLQQLFMAIAVHPQMPVSRLDYLTAAEKQQLIHGFNSTAAAYPAAATIGGLFAQQARLTPDITALKFENAAYTYRELDEITSRMARYFQRQYGLQSENRAGILLERSDKLIIAILAILKAGAAYVPVDPEWPAARKQLVVSDTGIQLLITQTDFIFDLDFYTGPTFAIDVQTEYEALEAGELETDLTPGSLAYIMFTSGSTGTPKGVMVEHRSVVRLVKHVNYAQLNETDTILGLSAYVFDGSVFDIFGALLNGGTLVMPRKDVFLDAEKLCGIIQQEGVTCFFVTTALFNLLADAPAEPFTKLRRLLFGGERTSVPHVQRFIQKHPDVQVVNVYGPTENTCFSTYYPVAAADASTAVIPIGRPISNSTAYILDDNLQPVPIGIVGEICVGGDGLARGYLNQPELTAEKFITHPFIPAKRLYRTGDLGRWLPDGSIEFTGRNDEQVKIRGYRIEPGEIESALLQWPGVEAAAVVVRSTAADEKELAAYIAAPQPLPIKNISNYLAAHLPPFMMPAHIIQLEQLPLNANGKVNRKLLPEPGRQVNEADTYVAPRTATEEKLAAVWEEVLERTGIGATSNFFEMGGHSLKATRLASHIHRAFDVKIELKDLFARPVLEGQARMIDEAVTTVFESIPLAPEQDGYPLSSSQKRLWVLSQFPEASVAYNMPGLYELEGLLDVAALQNAFDALMERHEILRTVFREDGEDEVRQYIMPAGATGFNLVSLPLNSQAGENSRMDVEQWAQQPFNQTEGPLLRALVYETSEKQWLLVYVMHHIISDAWSMEVLVKELVTLYSSIVSGTPSGLPPLQIQYKDYAVWQQQQLTGGSFEKHRGYWLRQFEGELPVLQIPGDKPRPPLKTYNGHTITEVINPEHAARLRQLVKEEGATLYMGLLAVVSVLLRRYSGQNDLVIGSPIAGRHHADLNGQIGFYLNTLALRCRMQPGQNFREWLSQVRQLTMDAYAHQLYPFDSLVGDLNLRRDMSRSALFDVMVILQNAGTGSAADIISNMHIEQLAGAGQVSLRHYSGTPQDTAAKFDLMFTFAETAGQLLFALEFNTDIYSHDTARRLAAHFNQLLAALTDDSGSAMETVNFLNETETRQLLSGNNSRHQSLTPGKTAIDYFEEQVLRTPDATAITMNGASLTFSGLNTKINQLAHWLRNEHHLQPEQMVAISMERSLEMVITLLAVLKSGAGYIPVDPAYPAMRSEYMLSNSGVSLVMDAAAWSRFEEEAGRYSGENPQKITELHHRAYVLYTSGSTGQPKGVEVEHRSLAALMDMLYRSFCSQPVSMPLMSYISFDVSLFEIFLPLMSGGTLEVLGRDAVMEPGFIAGAALRGNALFGVAPALQQLCRYIQNNPGAADYSHIRQIFTAGEAVSTSLLQLLRACFPQASLHNLYGPTEATVYVTWQAYETGCDAGLFHGPLLGHPLTNTHVYILDTSRKLVPAGVVGELYAGGACVARGYLHQPELTAERFVENPYVPGERLYKTGDAARWLPDGSIEFFGRIDNQVKVRGYRIELGEIEAALLEHPQVTGAVVLAWDNAGGEKELVAYITATEDLTVTMLRQHLGDRLPLFMVPGFYQQLEQLPVSSSGKIDRQALPAPAGMGMATGTEYIAPRNELEEKLAVIWQEVLDLEKVGVQDNFFELGGHSLKATRMVLKVKKELNAELGIMAIFTGPTIEQMAAVISRELWLQTNQNTTAAGEDLEQVEL